MYLLFKFNKITRPSEFYELKRGEKIILAALIEREIEDMEEYYKNIGKSIN